MTRAASWVFGKRGRGIKLFRVESAAGHQVLVLARDVPEAAAMAASAYKAFGAWRSPMQVEELVGDVRQPWCSAVEVV